MSLTERYDADICPAEWLKMIKDAYSWDTKRKYQPSPESPETEISNKSISDFPLNKGHPWGYDKLGKTNLFHLFSAAETQYLYTSEGDAGKKALNLEARHELDSDIARMFYSGGAAFNLAKNSYYVSSYTEAANSKYLSGYVPPGYNLLRNSLLIKERAHIESCLNPLKNSWKEKGVSLDSDGWTDSQRRPIINFMAACESGPMFLKAINCEGEYKDKISIAKLLKECIDSVGHQSVVQVITDNAPVCRGAGLLIENQFPHIFWTPYVVHTLNLALKNICAVKNSEANAETFQECHWITNIIGDAMSVKIFIVNHNMRLSMFNEHSASKMLSVAETRFALSIIMLKRFRTIKQSLLNMIWMICGGIR
ncbi:hypothetical protein OROMI_008891 [Orobanche minor]